MSVRRGEERRATAVQQTQESRRKKERTTDECDSPNERTRRPLKLLLLLLSFSLFSLSLSLPICNAFSAWHGMDGWWRLSRFLNHLLVRSPSSSSVVIPNLAVTALLAFSLSFSLAHLLLEQLASLQGIIIIELSDFGRSYFSLAYLRWRLSL